MLLSKLTDAVPTYCDYSQSVYFHNLIVNTVYNGNQGRDTDAKDRIFANYIPRNNKCNKVSRDPKC